MSELLDKLGLKKKDQPQKPPAAAEAPVTPADIFGEKLVTAEELAEVLRIGASAIKRRVAMKQIPFIRIGTRVRFRPSKIAQWLLGNGGGELECIDIPSVPDKRTRRREDKKPAKAAPPAKKSKGAKNKKGKKK